MLGRYLVSFGLLLAIVCGLLSGLPFAARAKVRGGAVVEETWVSEFTLGSTGNWYRISEAVRGELERRVAFRGTGVVEVRSALVRVKPKTVTWSRNKRRYSAPGGQMVARVTWSTPAEARGGAGGEISLVFPVLTEMPRAGVVFRSGPYEMAAGGRRVFREVNAYGSDAGVALARMGFAMCAGLPIAMLLHSIGWGLRLRRMRQAQVAAFEGEAWRPEEPRVFPPSVTSEWAGASAALGIGGGIASFLALILIGGGYLSTMASRILVGIAVLACVVALIVGLIVRRRVVTVRVEAEGVGLSRGRGEPQWVEARWEELRGVAVRTRRNRGSVTRWLEIAGPDRRVWKVPSSTIGYEMLRDEVLHRYKRGQGARR